MSTTWTFEGTCPTCGGTLNLGETVIASPTLTTADMRCDDCLARWTVGVTATLTEAGLDRTAHRARHERQARQDRAQARAVEGIDPLDGMLR